jgi:hypothetical protein
VSFVAIAGLLLGGASTILSAQSGKSAKQAADREADLQRQAGDARNAAAQLEADVLEQQAGQTVAAAQRDMFDVQRAARLAESRALAVAAASGGGASAPTVLNVIGNIAKEGAYNGARALYAGEEQARLMRIQALEKRRLGQFDMTAGNLAGLASESKGRGAQLASQATILNTVGSLYGKYGGAGPGSGGAASGVNIDSAGSGDASVSGYA